jgi:hypothetical protein
LGVEGSYRIGWHWQRGVVSNFPGRPVSHFTVGISGHRWNKIPADAAPRVARQLASVFMEIDQAIRGEFERDGGRPPVLRLVANLAEGADQMAVASRPAGWLLHAILPFPRARYENDFAPANATGGVDRRPGFLAALAQADSIVELPGANDAVQSYEQAGECMLRESDLLVAVWDGLPGSGRGGTQAVIAQAMSLALPVIWIRSDRDEVPTVLSAATQSDQVAEAHQVGPDAIRRTVALVARGEWAHRSPPPIGPGEL